MSINVAVRRDDSVSQTHLACRSVGGKRSLTMVL